MTDPDMISALRGPQRPDPSGAVFSTPPEKLREMSGTGGQNLRRVQIIRHGATALNNDDVSVDRIRGWKDVPLSPDGKKEAEKLADKIAKDPPDAIVSSDLKRAHDTAEAISDKIGIPISTVSHVFRPWNVGKYAGQVSSKVLPILGELAAERPDEKTPQGESFNDFRKRFLCGVYTALKRHDGVVAIVAHHRNERLLNAWAKNGYPQDGAIDEKEFNQKGEHTGGVQHMVIPFDKIESAATEGGESPPLSEKERKADAAEIRKTEGHSEVEGKV